MKRNGFLFERICSIPNLIEANINASKGKKKRDEVVKFEKDLMNNITQIQRELIDHTFHTSEYSVFIKYEPKRREIYKLPYRDRVVQWAIMQVLEPIWCKCFTADTYACVRGRGLHSLLRKIRRDLYKDADGTKYCFKMDVKKFYPSINHDILKKVIREKIKDPDLLWLLDDVIDSADGVPIGNYVSQFFANLYLSELDHIMKESKGAKYYYRYADDIVVLSGGKDYLNSIQSFIKSYLENNRKLRMKENYQVFPVESRGIDFIGYVIYHKFCLARKRNKKALCKKVSALKKKGYENKVIRLMLASRLGFMYHCDSLNLLRKLEMRDWSDVEKGNSGSLTGSKCYISDILNKEIHIQAFEVKQSKCNEGKCLTIQFEVMEQLRDDKGLLWRDELKTIPRSGWVQHVTFTGSVNLLKQLDGIDFSDPIRCTIIKQQLDRGRCFYKIVPVKNHINN